MIGITVLAVIMSIALGITFVMIADCNTDVKDSHSNVNALGPAVLISLLSGGIVACLMWSFLR